MSPVPLAGQVEPAVAEQVQVTPVKESGKSFVTVAPIASPGPAFPASMV